ncbi:hypothetical protein PVAP13_6NG359600 [Panicum virgatum]|uniref:Uncharacterized protein n=1 Tax=Panicum virgatum TaxID=38727 RepID=A0A8T0R5V4_PANVG|nr:hypothetical protein PVAP13_6NG359600 [Panicum virgatum]
MRQHFGVMARRRNPGAHSCHNYKELIGRVRAFDPDRNMVLDCLTTCATRVRRDLTLKKA